MDADRRELESLLVTKVKLDIRRKCSFSRIHGLRFDTIFVFKKNIAVNILRWGLKLPRVAYSTICLQNVTQVGKFENCIWPRERQPEAKQEVKLS